MKLGAFCENTYRLEAVNYIFKSLILDVLPSSEYICVYDSYLCFVLTLYLIMVWCTQSIYAARLPPPRRVAVDKCHQ